MAREKITITKRKAKGVLAGMIADMNEDSLAKTREEMKMTTEDYCSYEIAKLLKEKGFPMDEHLFMYVNKDDKLMTDHQACLTMTNEEYRTFFDSYIPTVTQSLAMKWLREKDIDIVILPLFKLNGGRIYCYEVQSETDDIRTGQFDTYEEAVEAALKYCLTKLI